MIPGSLNTMMMGGDGSDPYFANVSSLLHFDGADTSTTFTDEIGLTWTANGNVQIDTAQSVFGGASGLFDGAGDYISTAKDASLEFGSGDFTVEGRVRTIDNTKDQCFYTYSEIGAAAASQTAMQLRITGSTSKFTFIVAVGSTNYIATSTTTVANNTWYPFRLVRTGGNIIMLIDGAVEDTVAITGTINATAGMTARIGYYITASNRAMDGWVDEIRITKGVARDGGVAYSPATQALPDN